MKTGSCTGVQAFLKRFQVVKGLYVSYRRIGDVICVAEDLVRE